MKLKSSNLLKMILLLLLMTQTAFQISVNTTIETTDTTANIVVNDGDTCCCKVDLWIFLHLHYEKFNCSANTDCHMCRSFTMTDLNPSTFYYIYYHFPNNTKKKYEFQTKSLLIKLELKIKWNNIHVTVDQFSQEKITSCTFKLKFNGTIVDYCSYKCENCSSHYFKALEDDKNYSIEYKNLYMENIVSRTFSVDLIPYKIVIKTGYTFASFTAQSDTLVLDNCSITISDSKNYSQILNRSNCSEFTINDLSPQVNYFTDVVFGSKKIGRTVSFKTDNLFITQKTKQTLVNTINVIVSVTSNAIEEPKCQINFDLPSLNCVDACPTDCSNYSILIDKITASFYTKMNSSQSLFVSNVHVYPTKLTFQQKHVYIENGLLHVNFEPNLGKAGTCIVKAFINETRVLLECKDSVCSTDCDSLNFVLKNMPYFRKIKFTIENLWLEKSLSFTVIGSPEIHVNKTVDVTATSALIQVTSLESNICCCSGSFRKYFRFFFIFKNCDGYEDCRACRSFRINDLTPFTWYDLTYDLPNGTNVKLEFQTKHAEATINITSHEIALSVNVATIDNLDNNKCSFELYNENEVVDSCSHTCNDCYFHKFSNLLADTPYHVVYKNDFLGNAIAQDTKTIESTLNYSVNVRKNFHTILLSISSNKVARGLCNVVAQDEYKTDIDTQCSSSYDCEHCISAAIYGLDPDKSYNVKIMFLNHRKSSLYHITTEYIKIRQIVEQIEIFKYRVSVSVETTSKNLYSCTVSLNNSKASCENFCPVDCTSFFIVTKSKVNVESKITSNESITSSVVVIKPKSFEITLNLPVIDYKSVTFTFVSNLVKAGECIVEFWTDKTQITPECITSKCSKDCDSLILIVLNLYTYTSVKIIVYNEHLEVPFEHTFNLNFSVIFNGISNVTTNSAEVSVLHGNKCCCNGTLVLRNQEKVIFDSCGSDYDCSHCRSFNLQNLLPNTNYIFKFLHKSINSVSQSFKTDPIDPSIILKVSFSHASLFISDNYSRQTKMCKFEARLQNKIVQSCDINCLSCAFIFFSPLIPNEQYTFSYRNIYMNRIKTVFFSTIRPEHKLPKVLHISQEIEDYMTFIIDTNTSYDYNGTYMIFIINNVNSNQNYTQIKRGEFTKLNQKVSMKINATDSFYHGIFCFKINEKKCLTNPNIYTCSQCNDIKFSVCSKKNLIPGNVNLTVSDNSNKIIIEYSNTSLNCHNEMKCIFGYKYVLRKEEPKYSFNLLMNESPYSALKGFYVLKKTINHSECVMSNKLEIDGSHFSSRVRYLRSADMYSTPIIALCDFSRCITTQYMINFKITPPKEKDVIICVIFSVLGLIFWVIFALLMLFIFLANSTYQNEDMTIIDTNPGKIEMKDNINVAQIERAPTFQKA